MAFDLVIHGGGKMGEALLAGLIGAGWATPPRPAPDLGNPGRGAAAFAGRPPPDQPALPKRPGERE